MQAAASASQPRLYGQSDALSDSVEGDKTGRAEDAARPDREKTVQASECARSPAAQRIRRRVARAPRKSPSPATLSRARRARGSSLFPSIRSAPRKYAPASGEV